VNRPRLGSFLLAACLLSLLSPRFCSAVAASGPFASSCLTGRYVTTGSGLDITFLNPFAVVGFINFTCTKIWTGNVYRFDHRKLSRSESRRPS